MIKKITILCLGIALIASCKSKNKSQEETHETVFESKMDIPSEVSIIPIEHATAVLEWNDVTLYIDPVGGKSAFEGQNSPDIILVTDIHGDHFNLETLQEVSTENTTIILPQAVADEIPSESTLALYIMNNGDTKTHSGIAIEAIPMYNLREEALDFHTKGRGNGYLLTIGGQRLYFSGDTEDIPEMRALKNIDKAFVCMNLPYTMTEDSAADAVLEFQPKEVYPYHYRGRPDVSDVKRFKELVNKGNPSIGVIQLDWYPNDDF
ncbi:MAG: MBL fold metallo-hydrolase [Flavobacteriaceae bacterium]|uniref:MBL fold metallo-hydrolase n=1 Tax=Flagellimonas sp. SN16 TaxID=3415142 RepID=UPI003C5CB63F|nr:MBL fold metallo-hydrolase [Flavobacteriaceae bacterium]